MGRGDGVWSLQGPVQVGNPGRSFCVGLLPGGREWLAFEGVLGVSRQKNSLKKSMPWTH